MTNGSEEQDDAAEAPPARTWKSVISTLVKCALLVGIVFYLLKSKNLEPAKFASFRTNWQYIIYGLLLLLPTLLLATFRFQMVLRALGLPSALKTVFAWTMIGNFFDVAAPFTGGGDIVKAVYVTAAAGKGRRSVAALSIVLDRVIGMFALFLFALCVCLVAFQQIKDQPQLLQVARWLAVVCGSGVVAFFVVTARFLVESETRKRLVAMLPMSDRLERVYEALAGLRSHPRTLFGVVALSLLNHLFGCLSIFCLAQGLNFTSTIDGSAATLDLLHSLVVLPLALFLNTFGVAGGFGVGEIAFEKLFALMLKVREGAELAFVFHVVVLAVRLMGFPFVLFYRKHKHAIAPVAPQESEKIETRELSEA